jgi:hypothetical protein
MGLMTNRDFQNYSSLLNWWNQQLKPWFINLFKKLYPNLVDKFTNAVASMNPQFPSII